MDKINRNQRSVFLNSEGDEFYSRNKEWMLSRVADPGADGVIRCLSILQMQPTSVLEIGCANGWRLQAVHDIFNARCCGVEPSAAGVAEGRALYPHLDLQQGTADNLPFKDESFDAVIAGFCLYLCDRPDLFKIAYEIDRVLADNGTVVILDFHPPFPYRNAYKHHAGLFSYKMDYARMFSWNPEYTLQYQQIYAHDGSGNIDDPNERISVTAQRKNRLSAYPENPI